MAYVPERYWAGLHERAADERAVGFANLAASINRARYDVERRNVARALAEAGVDWPRRVLDAGSGTGVWVDFWERHGATEITGSDLVDAAITPHRCPSTTIGHPTEERIPSLDASSATLPVAPL